MGRAKAAQIPSEARESDMPILQEGETAPDFTVKAHTGETIKLSQYRGKKVLLWFYPMADTPG